MAFSFTLPTTVKYGECSFAESIPGLLSAYKARSILFVTGSRGVDVIPDFPGRLECEWELITVTGEPSEEGVQKACQFTQAYKPDLIVSIGGGSVIDFGKAISYLAHDERELDYFFQHAYVEKETIPHIAVPTTCGTGAEVTENAVITRTDKKVSLRAKSMRPDVAIVDPVLTEQLPLSVLVPSSLDALTQLIEAYVSNEAHPLTDLYCTEGLRLFQRSFHVDRLDRLSTDERLDLQLAACYSGIALSNSKLGIVHGLASVIGGQYSWSHGLICATLLRPFSELNVKALYEKRDACALARYKKVSEVLHQNADSSIEDLFTLLKHYESALNRSGLERSSMRHADLETTAEKSLGASSTQGNPVALTTEQVKKTLGSIYSI